MIATGLRVTINPLIGRGGTLGALSCDRIRSARPLSPNRLQQLDRGNHDSGQGEGSQQHDDTESRIEAGKIGPSCP